MEVFLPYLALAQRNVRLELRGASRTFEVPLRTRSRSSLASLWACRSGRRRVVPLAKSTGTTTDPESFLAATSSWSASSRNVGTTDRFFRVNSSSHSVDQDAGWGPARVLPRFVPICPEVSIAPATSFMHDVRSCFYLSGGVSLASPRALSDRTSLTRFCNANAPANS
jgi:hypothetical protein